MKLPVRANDLEEQKETLEQKLKQLKKLEETELSAVLELESYKEFDFVVDPEFYDHQNHDDDEEDEDYEADNSSSNKSSTIKIVAVPFANRIALEYTLTERAVELGNEKIPFFYLIEALSALQPFNVKCNNQVSPMLHLKIN
jgi:hypothetical protein